MNANSHTEIPQSMFGQPGFFIKQEPNLALIKAEPDEQQKQKQQPKVLSKTHSDVETEGAASTGKSSSKRKMNMLTYDNSSKIQKLLQMPFKVIRLQKAGYNGTACPKSGQINKGTSINGEIALFLTQLRNQAQKGLPSELVAKQIDEFSSKNGVATELLHQLLQKMQEEWNIVRNAERLVLGQKFKGVSASQLNSLLPQQRSAIKSDVKTKQSKKTLRLKHFGSPQPASGNEGDVEAEDIFIDEDLQMIAPIVTHKKRPMVPQIKQEYQQEQSEFTMNGQEEASTASNMHEKAKKFKTEKKADQPVSTDPYDFPEALLNHDTIQLGRIPRKSNIQKMIDEDNASAQNLMMGSIKDQNLMFQEEAYISEYENTENVDFCQHPRAGQFLIDRLQHLVSIEDSCHVNSVSSAQKLAAISCNQLFNHRLKIERLVILQVLVQTKNVTILNSFIVNGGLQSLFDWLQNLVQNRLEVEKNMSLLEEQIMERILIVLAKCPLTVELLKQIKVGKLVNQIRMSNRASRLIRGKASCLVNQWKQLVLDYKKIQASLMVQPELPPQYPMNINQYHGQFQQQMQAEPIQKLPSPYSGKSSGKREITTDLAYLLDQTNQLLNQDNGDDVKQKEEKHQHVLELFKSIESQPEKSTEKKTRQSILKKSKGEIQKNVSFKDPESGILETIENIQVAKVQAISQKEMQQIELTRDKMEPLLDLEYVRDSLEMSVKIGQERAQSQQMTENQKESQREHFISEVSNPHLSENPVFTIQGQSQEDFPALVNCDLDQVYDENGTRKEELEKTEKILSKLLQILESDAESIIHNRDVFTQILAAVDKETISVIFKAPKAKKQIIPESSLTNANRALHLTKKLTESVQKLIYQMIIQHYLRCNPILGNLATLQFQTEKEKEIFYKQAKEFFFTQPFKSPTQPTTTTQQPIAQPVAQPPIQQAPYNYQPAQIQVNSNQISSPFGVTNGNTNIGCNDQQTTTRMNNLQPSMQNPQMQIQQPFPAYQQEMQMNQYQYSQLDQQLAPQFQQPNSQPFMGQQQMNFQMNPFGTLGGINTMNNIATRPKNYRTVPCRMYHGIQGCMRGDLCHFIHDPSYQGQEIPREVLLRLRHENLQKFQTGQLSGIPVTQIDQNMQQQIGGCIAPKQAEMAPVPVDQLQQKVEDMPMQPIQPAPEMMNQEQQEQKEMITDPLPKIQQKETSGTPQSNTSNQNSDFKSPQAQGQFEMGQPPLPGQFNQQVMGFNPAMNHPYFNPAFRDQYYMQQEIYKQQQQAQLIANLTQNDTQGTQEGSTKNENQLEQMNQGVLGNIGMAQTVQPVDYQQKILLDKKTQDTHRKLLEQIKQDKEKRKVKYLEKYQKKIPDHQNQDSPVTNEQQLTNNDYAHQTHQQHSNSIVNQEIEVNQPAQDLKQMKNRQRSRSRSMENNNAKSFDNEPERNKSKEFQRNTYRDNPNHNGVGQRQNNRYQGDRGSMDYQYAEQRDRRRFNERNDNYPQHEGSQNRDDYRNGARKKMKNDVRDYRSNDEYSNKPVKLQKFDKMQSRDKSPSDIRKQNQGPHNNQENNQMQNQHRISSQSGKRDLFIERAEPQQPPRNHSNSRDIRDNRDMRDMRDIRDNRDNRDQRDHSSSRGWDSRNRNRGNKYNSNFSRNDRHDQRNDYREQRSHDNDTRNKEYENPKPNSSGYHGSNPKHHRSGKYTNRH